MSNTPYPAGTSGASDPYTRMDPVTPSDTADLEVVPRGLLLSAEATVKVQPAGGGDPIARLLPAGYNPIRVSRIYATGTDVGVTITALW